MTDRQTVLGSVALAAFVLTVLLANWLLRRYGIISLGFGLTGPAGVLAAGLAFGLRDVVHETLGPLWVVAGILVGTALSWLIESGVTLPGGMVPLAVASAVAFLVSEVADFAVYGPLRDRQWQTAVILSNLVGAVVDSMLFLWLAFGSLAHLFGQIVGKSYMTLLALPLVWMARRALSRDRLRSAST